MYKVFTSKLGKQYLYETSSNNFFELDFESRSKIACDCGSTESLKVLGDSFYDEAFGDAPHSKKSSYSADHVPNGDDPPEILVLELTQQCNFRCDYCIYSGAYHHERAHANRSMETSDIALICDRFFSSEKTPAYVSFYGGEPLLRFDLIKELCERIDVLGKAPKYSVTTNASMLKDDAILLYLIDRDFHLNLSFDGLNHDLYRKNIVGEKTASVVLDVIERIADISRNNLLKNVTLSMTLAPPYSMLENAAYIMNHPLLSQLRISVNLVNEYDNDFMSQFNLRDERERLIADIDTLADVYIETTGPVPKFLASLFGQSAARIDSRDMTHQSQGYPPGQCDVGKHRLFITAEGNVYMCERVGNYGRLGSLADSSFQLNAYKRVISDISSFYERGCSDCYLARVCDMCCSSMRLGNELKTAEYAQKECDDRRSWYDLIFYVYLSRKELGKGVFGDDD